MSRLYFFLFSMLVSLQGFGQWQQMVFAEGGYVYEIEKVGDQLWAGTIGGIYISGNLGQSWEISDMIPREYQVLELEAFGDEIYVVAGPSTPWSFTGVSPIILYKSKDAGQTWQSTIISTIGINSNIGGFEFTKSGTTLMFKWAHYLCFISTDDGATWSQAALPLNRKHVSINGSTILAATPTVAHLSTDFGDTWTEVLTTDAIGDIKVFDSLLFITCSAGNLFSNDLGSTWDTLNFEDYPSSYHSFQRDSAGVILAYSEQKSYHSSDNGATWELFGSALSEYNNLVYNNTFYDLEIINGIIYSNGFGGVYIRPLSDTIGVYSNKGIFAQLNNTLSATPDGQVFVNSHATGTFRSTDKGHTWEWFAFDAQWSGLWGGDIDQYNDTIFTAFNTGYVLITQNENINLGWNGEIDNSVEYENGILYHVSYGQFIYSINYGQTWETIPNAAGSVGSWDDISVENGTILAIDQVGDVYRTIDHGANWAKVHSGVQNFGYYGYTFLPMFRFIEGKHYLIGKNGQWKSEDDGVTWTPLSIDGLPLQPNGSSFQAMALHGNHGMLFLGIWGQGVYVSYDDGQHWSAFNEGLSNYNVTASAISGDMLYVMTKNGGVWKRNIWQPSLLGVVYEDVNNNGIREVGERPLSDIVLRSYSPEIFTTSEGNGNFSFFAQSFGDTLTAISPSQYANVNPPYRIVPPGGGIGLDFGIHFTENINDLRLTMSSLHGFVPGEYNNLYLTINNDGTTDQTPVVTLQLPDNIYFPVAEPQPTTISGRTLTWNLPRLQAQSSTEIVVRITTDKEGIAGDSIHISGIVIPIDHDETPANNTSFISDKVVEKLFTNTKTVGPSNFLTHAQGEQGETLTYTIRYQNWSDHAVNAVTILDTLSENLDLTTVSFLASSHPYQWTTAGDRSIKVVINGALPPAFQNPEASQGFIKFSVRTKPGLTAGTHVDNTAHIIYQFASEATTNTATVIVQEEVSDVVQVPHEVGPLIIMPNPNNGQFQLQLPFALTEAANVEVMDKLGRVVLVTEWQVGKERLAVNAANLATGGYFVRVKSRNKLFVGKMVVER